jgi:hypothetical protein
MARAPEVKVPSNRAPSAMSWTPWPVVGKEREKERERMRERE